MDEGDNVVIVLEDCDVEEDWDSVNTAQKFYTIFSRESLYSNLNASIRQKEQYHYLIRLGQMSL